MNIQSLKQWSTSSHSIGVLIGICTYFIYHYTFAFASLWESSLLWQIYAGIMVLIYWMPSLFRASSRISLLAAILEIGVVVFFANTVNYKTIDYSFQFLARILEALIFSGGISVTCYFRKQLGYNDFISGLIFGLIPAGIFFAFSMGIFVMLLLLIITGVALVSGLWLTWDAINSQPLVASKIQSSNRR